MIKVRTLLSRGNYFILSFFTLVLLQSYTNTLAFACPEPGMATWFIGILELEGTILPEKIKVIPSYDTNYRPGENGVFFGFFIFNETKMPIHIFGLDNLDTLIEAHNNDTLLEQVNQLLTNKAGFQVNPKQNRPVFRLNGPMLQSFDPQMVEYNQFDYSLPENLEIPSPQHSSFLIISDEEIYTISYQLSYELNNNFYEEAACPMDKMTEEFASSTTSSPSGIDIFLSFVARIFSVRNLILLAGGIIGIFVLKWLFS